MIASWQPTHLPGVLRLEVLSPLIWPLRRHQVRLFLPLRQGLGSLTRGHPRTCQVPHPSFLAYPACLLLTPFPLLMAVSVPLRARALLLRHRLFPCRMSYMFRTFPLTYSPLVRLRRPSSAPSISFLTTAPFRTCGRARGLVWDVRPDAAYTSSSPILPPLASVVFSPRGILHSSGIEGWAIPVLPNFV